jgi:hypothetical protein
MTVCHLHYAKSEEQNNNNDMNSSDWMNLDTDCINTDCTNTECKNTNFLDTDCMYTDCTITDCIYVYCIIKNCINKKIKHADCIDTDHVIKNLYCFNSYDMNSNRVTDSHVKLNILDNMQKCSNNSHHKIAFHSVFVSQCKSQVLPHRKYLSPKTSASSRMHPLLLDTIQATKGVRAYP